MQYHFYVSKREGIIKYVYMKLIKYSIQLIKIFDSLCLVYVEQTDWRLVVATGSPEDFM